MADQSPWAAPADESAGAHARRRRWPGRLLTYVLTVAVLVTLNFLLPRVLPGDPITAFEDPGSTTYIRNDDTRSALKQYYGLDRPLGAQYVRYLGGLARGDLGVSIRYRVPVVDVIAARLPWTLLLVGTAMVLAAFVGLLAGVHSGWRRGRSADRGLLTFFLTLSNVPTFLLASLLLLLFSVRLNWFPLAGSRTPFSPATGWWAQIADVAHHLALPAIVLAIEFAAGYFLLMRAGVVAELGGDHLLWGRARGLRDRRLKYGYAARNALLPVVTVAALQFGFAVTGAIFIERVFAYPGMGRLLFDSVGLRDYPTLQGCFLVITLAVVTANFVAEAAYARLDPRTVR
ncbi:MAG: ABC transporter permease [Actinomycetota bacterium]|nr:ABC transporter permease [Actinomycetota bacterium]